MITQTDRHGGHVLEYVARRHPMKARRWEVCARTQSYGGRYYVPIHQLGADPALNRFTRKRDAAARAAAMNSERGE